MGKYEHPSIKLISAQIPSKMGVSSKIQPLLDIENIPVPKLVQEYGSPLFVVSEKQIRENIQSAYQAFKTSYSKIQFAWSYKTNYLNEICSIFHQEGSIAEVVSAFELKKALNNGIKGDKIIFNGPNKNYEDLEFAISQNVIIHIDNYDELFTIEEIAEKANKKVNVAIRVNMKTGSGTEWERFGFNYENNDAYKAARTIIQSTNLNLIGLHCHIGTFILTTQPYAIAASKMMDLTSKIRRDFNIIVKYIDLGGGFASQNNLKSFNSYGLQVPHFKDYAESISDAIYQKSNNLTEEERPLLILETGRALIDNTTTLLTTVLSTKRNTKGIRITTIDAGVNILFTSFWYNHEIVPTRTVNDNDFYENTIVYGPLCMNIDVIRENVLLPNISKNDILAIKNVGAYNMTQWMQFINLRPAIVMARQNGGIEILKEKDIPEDIKY